MKIDELSTHFPKLFHMAEADAWESIINKGLLSTSALLDLYEVSKDRRYQIEMCHRPTSVPIYHRLHGRALIRDQKPMSNIGLQKCLVDMRVSDWYRLLNNKVFFFLTEKRLNRFLTAGEYAERSNAVFIINTAKLLKAYQDRITLSPINSGYTKRFPSPRGPATFLSIGEYPYHERRKSRGVQDAVAELAVEYAVPDIANFTIRVELRHQEKFINCLWENTRSSSN